MVGEARREMPRVTLSTHRRRRGRREGDPQRLKPRWFGALCGTAKAVP